MIALYSINLRIMGRPNIPLLRHDSIFDPLVDLGLSLRTGQTIIALLVVVIAIVSLHLFLGTELGQALRGTGDNETMMRSLGGVNTDRLKILGLAISNALVGLSGALVAQYQALPISVWVSA